MTDIQQPIPSPSPREWFRKWAEKVGPDRVIGLHRKALASASNAGLIAEERAKKSDTHAKMDGKTQLPNRTAFDNALERRISEQKRLLRENKEPPPITVAVLDLNYLKFFNDGAAQGHGEQFTHATGDIVIKYVADQLKAAFGKRVADMVARCGGDEFGVILYDTPLDKAKAYLDKVCQKIRDDGETLKDINGKPLVFKPNGAEPIPAPITLSYGCHEISPSDFTNGQDTTKIRESIWADVSQLEGIHKKVVKGTVPRAFDVVASYVRLNGHAADTPPLP